MPSRKISLQGFGISLALRRRVEVASCEVNPHEQGRVTTAPNPMAPIKRKTEAAVENARPEKKQKPSSVAKMSVMRAEEPAFPRGGASILTPLEHKQIQIQAKQDVLFEQSTGLKAAKNDYEEKNDEGMPEQPSVPVAKSKRGQKHKEKKGNKNGLAEEVGVRIEGLSYKVDDPGNWAASDG